MDLDVAAVQGDEAIGRSAAGACRGALQHLYGVPVAYKNTLAAQVCLHLHQFIHLKTQKQ